MNFYQRSNLFSDPAKRYISFAVAILISVSFYNTINAQIRLNQIGFYPRSTKTGIVIQGSNSSFAIVSPNKTDTVFRGMLSPLMMWAPSGENVSKADFSTFLKTGTYLLTANGQYSFPFHIRPQVHLPLVKGLLKSYYYNRASMAITAPWASAWPRALGHPDNYVIIHPSAVSEERFEGDEFASPRGWYDAGDYNKYMVNSGITTYSLLALYEHFPTYFDTLNTFIPESGKGLPDLLDEAWWNLSWMLTAQDPSDGGVYHKVTQLNFNGVSMPAGDNSFRYAVGKGTAAALNFAAVMAQASRIYSRFESHKTFAQACLSQSLKAYQWAQRNPNVAFRNPTYPANPGNNVQTGEYGDSRLGDEFIWARMELYITTKADSFYKKEDLNTNFGIPGWPNVSTLGLMSLVNHRKQLTQAGWMDTTLAKTKLFSLANPYRMGAASSAYGTSMGAVSGDFYWGSNSGAGNQGMVLMQAFRATGDSTYLQAAISNLDYLLGRNATNYSFVTGFGSRTPMKPHHRISEADNVAAPIPGMLVGGPNPGQQDAKDGAVYPSTLPARSYSDVYASYASNEPAINYTASIAYLAGAVEATLSGAADVPTGINEWFHHEQHKQLYIQPNPFSDVVNLSFVYPGNALVTILTTAGQTVYYEAVLNGSGNCQISTEHLPAGMYYVSIATEQGVFMGKIVKQ